METTGYYGRKCELELVTYFEENAVALKKIIIRPQGQPRHQFVNTERIKREKAGGVLAKMDLEGKTPKSIELIIF